MKPRKSLYLLIPLLMHALVAGAAPAKAKPPQATAESPQFCIMEGVGKQLSQSDAQLVWEPLQQAINKTLGEPTRFKMYQSFDSIEEGIKNSSCDVLLVKPVHYAGLALRVYGYEPVARVEGAYIGNFVVRHDSPIKTYADLAGKTIMLPDEKSLQTLLAKRYFKEHPLNPPPILRHTRLQETVLFAVETKAVDAGWVNPTLANQWEQNGSGWMSGAIRDTVVEKLTKEKDEARLAELQAESIQKQKIMHKTEPYPYWVVLTSKRINGHGPLLKQALLNYGKDPVNEAALKRMGIKKGFAEVDGKARSFYESLL